MTEAPPPPVEKIFSRPRDGRGVLLNEGDWDDLGIWLRCFRSQGWRDAHEGGDVGSTDGDEGTHSGGGSSSSSIFGLGSSGTGLLRMTGAQRAVLHDKIQFFKTLLADEQSQRYPGVPATFFDLPSCEEALHKEGRPGAIFFYKEGQASRGSGVFPFQVIDDSLRERVAESSGIFQQEVPRMLLWPCSRDDLTGGGDEPKRKFDLRALAFFGPGRRCWACRRFWVRVAGTSYDTGNMSREVHCTNLSVKEAAAQGEEVEALPDSSMGDLTSKVSFNLVKAMGIIASKVAGSLPTEGRYQYFGFDFILDQDLQPWVLEANSTPHLTRCNRGSCSGQVDDVLKDLIENVMEPVLGLPHGKAEIVGGVEDPKSLWNLVFDPSVSATPIGWS